MLRSKEIDGLAGLMRGNLPYKGSGSCWRTPRQASDILEPEHFRYWLEGALGVVWLDVVGLDVVGKRRKARLIDDRAGGVGGC